MTDRGRRDEPDRPEGMSTWAKVTLLVLGVVAIAIVLMLLIGGGGIGGHQIPEHAPLGLVGA